jgi:Flp pilus assembly protein TadD
MIVPVSCTDLRQGQHERAMGHLRQALALFTQMGEQPGEAQALNGLGEAFLAAGRPDDARVQHRAALAVATQIGHKYEQARAENGLGHTYLATGAPDQARTHWRKALSLFTALGTPEAAEVRTRLNKRSDRGYTEPTPVASERLVER